MASTAVYGMKPGLRSGLMNGRFLPLRVSRRREFPCVAGGCGAGSRHTNASAAKSRRPGNGSTPEVNSGGHGEVLHPSLGEIFQKPDTSHGVTQRM
jgi:hypothetical protein